MRTSRRPSTGSSPPMTWPRCRAESASASKRPPASKPPCPKPPDKAVWVVEVEAEGAARWPGCIPLSAPPSSKGGGTEQQATRRRRRPDGSRITERQIAWFSAARLPLSERSSPRRGQRRGAPPRATWVVRRHVFLLWREAGVPHQGRTMKDAIRRPRSASAWPAPARTTPPPARDRPGPAEGAERAAGQHAREQRTRPVRAIRHVAGHWVAISHRPSGWRGCTRWGAWPTTAGPRADVC